MVGSGLGAAGQPVRPQVGLRCELPLQPAKGRQDGEHAKQGEKLGQALRHRRRLRLNMA